MIVTRAIALAALVWLIAPVRAHGLDEYVQATLISLETDRVELSLRLTPGVAVMSTVMQAIDRDGNGRVSNTEQRQYAERVLQDLSLSLDGRRLHPRLVSVVFPDQLGLEEGGGEIHIELVVGIPAAANDDICSLRIAINARSPHTSSTARFPLTPACSS